MNAVIRATPWPMNEVKTTPSTQGSIRACDVSGRCTESSPNSLVKAVIGTATMIGARKPVPIHIGVSASQAGARSPQRWVNVRASSIATVSMKKVRMLSASITEL